MIFSKESKLYSVFKFKCPHCHEGDFFVSKNPYDLSKAGDIHEHCPVCKRKLSIEPGFYYGAMYVAYALAVATYVSFYVATMILYPEASTLTYILIIIAGLIITGPWLYALSKIIWGNLFIAYKGIEPTPREVEAQRAKQQNNQQ